MFHEQSPCLKCSTMLLKVPAVKTTQGDGDFPLHLMGSRGAWEPLHKKPSLSLLGGRLIFKGNSIHSSGSACQCSPTQSRQPVSNVLQDFDLCLSFYPHSPVRDPDLPHHHVPLIQFDSCSTSNSKVCRQLQSNSLEVKIYQMYLKSMEEKLILYNSLY